VPGAKPDKVVLVVFPAIAPGFSVQLPDGKPVKITLPVDNEHVGSVIVPTTGTDGTKGCGSIITLADAKDVHPDAFVTVKVYEPEVNPVTVLLMPVPAIAPGFKVQFPAGKLFKTTLPVAVVQVGCVIVPTVGASGVKGCAFIIVLADGIETHPAAFVTVKLYEPALKPEMVLLNPVPVMAPGLIVQFPAGKPLNIILPVDTEHVGCIAEPVIGVSGIAAIITMFEEADEVHPEAFVTV
jgi:hypothetical protein